MQTQVPNKRSYAKKKKVDAPTRRPAVSAQPVTVAKPEADARPETVVRLTAEARAEERSLLSILNSNLVANVIGGLLVFVVSFSLGSYYESLNSDERRAIEMQDADRILTREKRDAERIALTSEISPWLVRLWEALTPLVGPNLADEPDAALISACDGLREFGYVAETPVLAARIAKAFGEPVRDRYLDLLTRNQDVEYIVRSVAQARRLRATLGKRGPKEGPLTASGLTVEEEQSLREVPAKVDSIMKSAYALGNHVRNTTFGPQPEILR